jgi:succinate dehydrogenase (ubiquinone) membrane anchor subunit
VSHAGSSHWNAERYLSLALLGIIPAALIMENQVGDFVLASSLILHSWWGLNQIVTDYLHGPTLPKIGFGVLTATCLVALVGMLYFNYADMGLAKALKKLWSL